MFSNNSNQLVNQDPSALISLVVKTNKGNFYLENLSNNQIEAQIFYCLLPVVMQLPVLDFQILHYKSIKFKSIFYEIEKFFFKQEILEHLSDKEGILPKLKCDFWLVYKYRPKGNHFSAKASQVQLGKDDLKRMFNSYSSQGKLAMIQIGMKIFCDFVMIKDSSYLENSFSNFIFVSLVYNFFI